MKTERLFVCIVAVSVSLVGCASKEQSDSLTPASREMSTSPREPATEESSEPRQCVSNDDCGKGYACGFDPELSHVTRYCMAE
jgi:hypothetical protein